MAHPGYLTFGERITVALSRVMHGLTHSPAYRWLHRHGMRGRAFVIAIPYVWLLLFFAIPFLIVLKIAFAETVLGIPPYSPLWQWAGEKMLAIKLNLANFTFLLDDPLYFNAYLYSVKVAGISTICVCCSAIRWPTGSRAPRPLGATCCC